ncbi:synemin [Tenrec ecaudatus]|uniref:synemin n=1 Tax=Tenrec ecaudatus TaxID=94439 RepID=UPI003F5A1F76
MLPCGLQTSLERAELQELNARLYDYVCRVRELERENVLLEEELRGRRGREDVWAQGQARFEEEARALRRQLDELSWATTLAEGERDALRRELQELQQVGAEVRGARGRLEAEWAAQEQELQEALGARAALEALLGRLQEERCSLAAAHERDLRALRARAASFPRSARARPAAPAAPLREAHANYALLVTESWRESVRLYEEQVRELEEAWRRGLESRREAEEETRLCALEAEDLRGYALELQQLRARLEQELLRMQEASELQAAQQQGVIDALEEEKAALAMAITEHLRDYQELVQAKTGLSLEVATYRALLEGESNPEILTWTEHIENVPPEFRHSSYQLINSVFHKENERNLLPRQKAPPMRVNHSPRPYSDLSRSLGSQRSMGFGSAAQGDLLGSWQSSVATTRQEKETASGQTGFSVFPPTYGLLRKTETQVKTLPERPKTEGASDMTSDKDRRATITPTSPQDDKAVGVSERTWSSKRIVTSGKKTEAETTREQGKHMPETIRTKHEEKVFDSKEKASEERNLRWEELTKLDKEARKTESRQIREPTKREKSQRARDVQERAIPISVEASQGSVPKVSPIGFQTPVKKDVGGGTGREVETREMRFRLDTGDAPSSLTGDSRTTAIAENIVSSILEQLTQPQDTEAPASSFPDTKVTYMGRKELSGDRKTKTEIIVESKLTEDVDVADEAGLGNLLSKNVKEVELKGKSTERMIGDIINLGLKGREGKAKVVNVEIIEEPLSFVGGEKAEEFSTLFEVEEADDVSPEAKGLVEREEYGETESSFSVSLGEKTKQSPLNRTRVEEVMEAGDWEGEQNYFVSTPDDHVGGHDREEGPVYGQIHIEEESTIKYSWQDEILQGTRRRRGKMDEALEEEVVQAADAAAAPSLEGGPQSSHWRGYTQSDQLHAESTVIEKEIKIPREFHTSIQGVFSKEPKHQLEEVIGQLEESLPERMREELSALTREGAGQPGSVSVDVQKVQTSGGGSMTLVAEVNLSQTVDADQLDLGELGRYEANEIERAVESVVRESLTKRQNQEPGSPSKADGAEAPATGMGFKRWATRELYSPSGEGAEASQASSSTQQTTFQGPVSATLEVSSPRALAQSQVLEDVSQSVRHVQVIPTEIWRTAQVSSEGLTTAVVEMDVSPIVATARSTRWTQESTSSFPAAKEVAAPNVADHGAWRDAGSREDQADGGSSQTWGGDRNQAREPKGREQAAFNKTVQLQRMVDQRSVVSDEKKVALLYLDSEEGEGGDDQWF